MLAGRVGPDARIANSKMVKPDFAAADWNRPTSGLLVIQEQSRNHVPQADLRLRPNCSQTPGTH